MSALVQSGAYKPPAAFVSSAMRQSFVRFSYDETALERRQAIAEAAAQLMPLGFAVGVSGRPKQRSAACDAADDTPDARLDRLAALVATDSEPDSESDSGDGDGDGDGDGEDVGVKAEASESPHTEPQDAGGADEVEFELPECVAAEASSSAAIGAPTAPPLQPNGDSKDAVARYRELMLSLEHELKVEKKSRPAKRSVDGDRLDDLKDEVPYMQVSWDNGVLIILNLIQLNVTGSKHWIYTDIRICTSEYLQSIL